MQLQQWIVKNAQLQITVNVITGRERVLPVVRSDTHGRALTARPTAAAASGSSLAGAPSRTNLERAAEAIEGVEAVEGYAEDE